jgi:hypothetical protein
MRGRLRESLKVALAAHDKIAAAAIRSAMSAIDNAEALEVSQAPPPRGGIVGNVRLGVGAGEAARRELSARDVVEVVRAEVRERRAAAAEYERLGRIDEASRLRAEAKALLAVLEAALEKN